MTCKNLDKNSKIEQDVRFEKKLRLTAKKCWSHKLLTIGPKINIFWTVFFVNVLILIVLNDFKIKSGGHSQSVIGGDF